MEVLTGVKNGRGCPELDSKFRVIAFRKLPVILCDSVTYYELDLETKSDNNKSRQESRSSGAQVSDPILDC